MPTKKIIDFVEDMKNLQYPILEFSSLAREIIKDPNKFSLRKLEDRVEVIRIGLRDIPKCGTFYFQDNEDYEYQNEQYKNNYPEFKDNSKALAIIEKVNELRLTDEKNVKVISERYLIMEAN